MTNTKQKVIDYLKKTDWPSTTEDIAAEIGVSWNTAQVQLLKLAHDGIVKYKKVGRQNQFWLSENYEKYFKRGSKNE
ncbi:MAG: FaeA/PapI family transcriptional regulator [Candidatus Woesearchaeota archaeon]